MINSIKFLKRQKWYIIKQMDQIQLIGPRKYGNIQLLLVLLLLIIFMQCATGRKHCIGIQRNFIFRNILFCWIMCRNDKVLLYEKQDQINIHVYYTSDWITYSIDGQLGMGISSERVYKTPILHSIFNSKNHNNERYDKMAGSN
eukprot:55660_1